MTYDLRYESWIPWRRRSGAIEWGPPSTLVNRISGNDEDPVVALAAPRADFDGALQEFLIGLLSAGFQPADESAWRTLWDAPPTPVVFQAMLDALPQAFDLDGEGPRFFQDFAAADFTTVAPNPVEQLLIDTPGDQGVRLNKDLFVKRSRIEKMGRPAAAMALLTLQTYAPAGGQGHRTSLRGGGPLTTLVDPRTDEDGRSRAHEQPLWYKLWANVETQQQQANRSSSNAPTTLASAFPWLNPTRTSNTKVGGRETMPSDTHPLQAYFGLPRRIRLEFGEAGRCDVTGNEGTHTVTGFRMLNYGTQYTSWLHPLSPHYRTKVSEPWLPVHGQPGGVGWRDWVTLALAAPADSLRRPAAVVVAFDRRGWNPHVRSARIHAFGYDMDNMKARAWVDAALPVFVVSNLEQQDLLYKVASALTDATDIVAQVLLGEVKRTLFNATGDFGQVRSDLWAATEVAFYGVMRDLAVSSHDRYAADKEAQQRREGFAAVLEHEALAVFDRWCPATALKPDALRRRVTARYDLLMALRGYSKLGERIFALLDISPPGGGRAARVTAKRTRAKTKSVSKEVAQ